MSISRTFERKDRRLERREQEARRAALYARTNLLDQLAEDRREDGWLLIMDKHEELHGPADLYYSTGQIEEVNAIITAYTPDEFDAAVALALARSRN